MTPRIVRSIGITVEVTDKDKAEASIVRVLPSLQLQFLACEAKNFARTRHVLAEDSFMTKGVLSAVAGFLGLCLSLFAQPTDGPGVFVALNNSVLRLPSLTLSDGAFFSFASAFNRMETTTPVFLPALSMATTTKKSQRATAAAAASRTDSSKEVVDMDVRRPNFGYAGGEAGFLFGVSSGKYGGTFEQGYILGEVGNDKFQISAGASYEHSTERFPRWGR